MALPSSEHALIIGRVDRVVGAAGTGDRPCRDAFNATLERGDAHLPVSAVAGAHRPLSFQAMPTYDAASSPTGCSSVIS